MLISFRSITCFGACDAMWFDEFDNRICEGKYRFTDALAKYSVRNRSTSVCL